MNDEHFNSMAFHPGEYIRDELKARQVTIRDGATGIGIRYAHLYDLIAGTEHVTDTLAHKLATYFGTSMELWMNLQSAYDLQRMKRTPR